MPASPHHPASLNAAAPSLTAPTLTAASRAAAHGNTGDGARNHLAVDGLSHGYPDRRVLSDISFAASPGDRIGLIGENGTGKSTLLRVIAGVEPPENGTVTLPGSVGLLAQELPYPEQHPIAGVLDDAQRGALEALRVIESLGEAFAAAPADQVIADQYAAALERAERAGAWTASARRGEVVAGLGLGGISESRPIGELSGGQRLRLALAALLLEAPQTILLDEPSNHLDDASAAYLERVLRDWPGIVIVASHDRSLLDAITTKILDLDPLPIAARILADAEAGADAATQGFAPDSLDTGSPVTEDSGSGFGARFWGVGYSRARRERREEMRRWRSRYAAETTERAALVHEIEVGSREVNRKHESKSESRITRKFYADKDARVTSRRARNARVRLETLERERVRRPPEQLRFRGFEPAAEADASIAPSPRTSSTSTAPHINATGVALNGRLAPISIAVAPHSRIMLTGPNGSGKSTLLGILAGELAPDQGSVERAARIGYLPQEVTFEHPERSAADTYRGAVGVELAESVPLASTGLLAARDQDRTVGSLSVGQRRRLALATLVADPPQVLLLDEPTNHLSLTLVEELEEALRSFPGALVIATHDRWLRARWEGAMRPIGASE